MHLRWSWIRLIWRWANKIFLQHFHLDLLFRTTTFFHKLRSIWPSMLMSSKMSIAVLVIITLIATNSLSEAAAADNVNLPDLLGTFSNKDMDCATTYVTSCYAESPELRCCQLIDSILSTDMACLCSLYENSHLTNGEGVSVLTLCQVSSDSLLRCNVGGNVTGTMMTLKCCLYMFFVLY